MPLQLGKVTAADFTLQNVTSPDQIAQLNASLQYLQQSPSGAAVILASAMTGVAIGFNPGGDKGYPGTATGTDGNSVESHLILWNPDSAMTMIKEDGTVTGVSSAASGLAHEMVHTIDPIEITNAGIKIPGYENAAEYVAVTVEGVINTELGEPTRDNHEGVPVSVENPTTHTDTTTGHWVQIGNSGQVETGPQYVYGQLGGDQAPDFGSTDPANTNTADNGQSDPPGPFSDPDAGGGDGGEVGCVAIESLLPDGRTAGEICVNDVMQLADSRSLEHGTGVVSFSKTKEAEGFRIVTESGVSLICSDTAPIPVQGGELLNPDKLLGVNVAVRTDFGDKIDTRWEKVTEVVAVGRIKVQHITVGNKCFWAGERKGAYVLHHNVKAAGDSGGGQGDGPWDDPLKAHKSDNDAHLTTHHGGPPQSIAQILASFGDTIPTAILNSVQVPTSGNAGTPQSPLPPSAPPAGEVAHTEPAIDHAPVTVVGVHEVHHDVVA